MSLPQPESISLLRSTSTVLPQQRPLSTALPQTESTSTVMPQSESVTTADKSTAFRTTQVSILETTVIGPFQSLYSPIPTILAIEDNRNVNESSQGKPSELMLVLIAVCCTTLAIVSTLLITFCTIWIRRVKRRKRRAHLQGDSNEQGRCLIAYRLRTGLRILWSVVN